MVIGEGTVADVLRRADLSLAAACDGSPWAPEICHAALRAHAVGRRLAFDRWPAPGETGPLLWHFRHHRLGLDGATVEAGIGLPEGGDCAALADAVFRRLAAHRPLDLLVLSIAGIAPEVRAGTGLRSALGGECLAVERRSATRAVLPLAADYESFLRELGYHTRRNMRGFRKKAERAGWRFSFLAEPPAAAAAPERVRLGLLTTPIAKTRRRLANQDRFIADQGTAFQAMIRAGDGELLSLAAGILAGDAAVLIYQLNHGGHPRASLSLTTRAFLTERLIERGITSLIFPGGGLGLLGKACELRRSLDIVMVRRSLPGLAKAAAVAALGRHHPAMRPLRNGLAATLGAWCRP